MAKAKNKPRKKFPFKKYLLPSILGLILTSLIILAYQFFLQGRYYPLTFVGDTHISFLTQGQAIQKLQNKFNLRSSRKLQFAFPQGSFTIDIATSSASLDYAVLDSAFQDEHPQDNWQNLQKQLKLVTSPKRISPEIKINLAKQLNVIEKAVNQPPIDAQLTFDETTTPEGSPSARIQIKEAVAGLSLDKDNLEKEVKEFILTGKYQPQLPLKANPPKVTTEKVKKAKGALEEVLTTPIKLQFKNQTWLLDGKQLLALLDLQDEKDNLLGKEKVYLYLGKIASEIDQEVQEGLFEFNEATKRVSAFKPSQEGQKLNLDKTFQLLTEALTSQVTKNITLPVDIVKPKIQTSDVNSLGIKELIGRGISNFAGSIPNRIYNVNLTAQKINGVLVAPGQTFSFNQTVGDISAATGYKQAYVIKEGRTVLDDGGGVCQDSTTLFRAVLNAGLPVVKRTAHAYRVGYYEQGFPPGLDATVFYPSVDFQFKNDTPAHILVQAYTVGSTLYVDLYGTDDGRTVSLTKPVITNQTPPPPELRQDDPTLPKGVVKQVDWSAWGAIVSFKRTVVRGNEVLIDETWKSFYKPWQAVYLVGTQ